MHPLNRLPMTSGIHRDPNAGAQGLKGCKRGTIQMWVLSMPSFLSLEFRVVRLIPSL